MSPSIFIGNAVCVFSTPAQPSSRVRFCLAKETLKDQRIRVIGTTDVITDVGAYSVAGLSRMKSFL